MTIFHILAQAPPAAMTDPATVWLCHDRPALPVSELATIEGGIFAAQKLG
jgi:hypothetical protein